MKVSKNSWHYRFNNYVQDGFSYRAKNEVFSTCTYIRTTAFSFLVALVKTLGIAITALVILWTLAGMVTLPLVLLGVIAKTATGVPSLVGFGVGGWLMTGIFGLGYVVEKLTPFFRARKEQRMSLLKQTLQDKKDGVCTLVEFE